MHTKLYDIAKDLTLTAMTEYNNGHSNWREHDYRAPLIACYKVLLSSIKEFDISVEFLAAKINIEVLVAYYGKHFKKHYLSNNVKRKQAREKVSAALAHVINKHVKYTLNNVKINHGDEPFDYAG